MSLLPPTEALPGVAFLFPGQGSHRVGMADALLASDSDAEALIVLANESVGFDLVGLMTEGPEETLRLTANAQPAILFTSILAFRALGLVPALAAGHSLGEYSALAAAGALDLGEALALVHRRGRSMQEAVPEGVGGMAAVLGMEEAEIRAGLAPISRPGHVVEIANLNGGGQIILSGHRAALDEARDVLKARRFLPLPVSAPFHCSLMKPAEDALVPLLQAIPMVPPEFPIVSNVDAQKVADPPTLRDGLQRQICRPVQWESTILRMAGPEGIRCFVEVGPGHVLAGLMKRLVPEARILNAFDPDSARRVRAALRGSA